MRPYDVTKWIMGLTISWPILKTPPFTDWQNDLHLIVDTAHAISLCPRIDLAKLIAAATRAFSGAHSIGSCEDRSRYVCCQVLH